MIWDIVEAKLITANLGVAGMSLFEEEMPAECSVGVMLRSPLSGIRIDQFIPHYYKPLLQVIVRHTDPVVGALIAQDVADTLTIVSEEFYPATADRGRVNLKVFRLRELPIRFPRLDGKSIEWSLNFITAFGLAAL